MAQSCSISGAYYQSNFHECLALALSQLEMFQQELCSGFLLLKASTGFINMGGGWGWSLMMWSLTFIKLTSGIDKMKLALDS